MTVQREGITRMGDDLASATAITGITSILFRDKSGTFRPEPTWDDAAPDPDTTSNENEVEITFKNTAAANSAAAAIFAKRQAGTTQQVFAMALTDDAVDTENPLYYATAAITGVELGGQAGRENTQRWVLPCGAIQSVTTDPAA